MNVFYVDHDPAQAARDLCDKHIPKMLVETCQMLSTAHRVYQPDKEHTQRLYKAAYLNHPCSVWVREAKDNYYWAYFHAVELNKEFTRRYGGTHASARLLDALAEVPFDREGSTPPALAMLDGIKALTSDPVEAYRLYYLVAKHKIAKWKMTRPPTWYVELHHHFIGGE